MAIFEHKNDHFRSKLSVFERNEIIFIKRSIAQNVVFVLKLDIFVKITQRDA